jgi:hypothetical protein
VEGLHAVGGHQLKYKYQSSVHLHVVYLYMLLYLWFVYDYCMYAFTVISALSYVIEEHKSSVKYWYVLLSLPQEYVYVQNVYVWLKLH